MCHTVNQNSINNGLYDLMVIPNHSLLMVDDKRNWTLIQIISTMFHTISETAFLLVWRRAQIYSLNLMVNGSLYYILILLLI